MNGRDRKRSGLSFVKRIAFSLLLILIVYIFQVSPRDIRAENHQKMITAHGFGLPRSDDKTYAERCVFARSAAEMDAKRQLAGSIESHIESLSRGGDYRHAEQNIKVIVNRTLIGSKIIDVKEYNNCERVEVVMQVAINSEDITGKREIDESQINQLTKLMVDHCQLGQYVRFEAKADGGISFWKKGVEGNFEASRNQIPSIMTFISSEKERSRMYDKIIECMKPHMDRIFDAILG